MARIKSRQAGLFALLAITLLAAIVFRTRLAWLPNHLAAKALRSTRTDDAQWWLSLGRGIAGENPRTELLRARAYRKLGDFDRADQHLQRARELGAAADRLEVERVLIQAQAGQIHEALPLLTRSLILAEGRDRSEVCEAFVLGLVEARMNIRMAIDLCNTWVAEFPADPRPHLFLSDLAMEVMEMDIATAELRRVLEIDSAHGPAALALGKLMLRKQEVDQAFQLFRIAARDEATRLAALAHQASCLRQTGRLSAAQTLLDEVVLAEDPDSELGNLECARLEIETGQLQRAIQRLRTVLDRAPNNHEAREALGLALGSVGHSDEASQHRHLVRQARVALVRAGQLVRRLPLDPADADVRSEIGRINLKYGDPELGLNWLQSALRFESHHRSTLQALVEFYERPENTSPQSARLAEEYRTRLAAIESGT